MARRPRPVNPDEGPVQAFAFALRALRESAGNPTYRALAKKAGYSATTLGDAAGGMHLPTLEVTLAYVGACGGDAAEWRARWQAVNRRPAGERAGAGSGPIHEPEDAIPAGAAKPAAQPGSASTTAHPPWSANGPVPPGRSRRGGRYFGPWIAVAAVLVAVLVVAAALLARQPGDGSAAAARHSTPAVRTAAAPISAAVPASAPASAPSSAHCPAVPAPGTAVAFTGTTYGVGVNVRAGASIDSALRLRIPAGCTVGFSGYCLGDVVTDATAGTPDMRWFIIPGVGEVASGVVHGDPPARLTAQPCPQGVPAPAAISLGVGETGTGGGVVELTATGSRLWIVGFAAYYATPAGQPPGWHQFGFGDVQTGGVFSGDPLRLDTGSAAVPVVAVACVGGDGPTSVVAAGAVRASAPQTLLAPPKQSAASLAAAKKAACQYPGEAAGS